MTYAELVKIAQANGVVEWRKSLLRERLSFKGGLVVASAFNSPQTHVIVERNGRDYHCREVKE